MVHKEVSLGCVLAWVGWVLAIAIAVVGLLFHLTAGGLAVVFAAGATTLHVREMLHSLEAREREAFRLGRESVRSLR